MSNSAERGVNTRGRRVFECPRGCQKIRPYDPRHTPHHPDLGASWTLCVGSFSRGPTHKERDLSMFRRLFAASALSAHRVAQNTNAFLPLAAQALMLLSLTSGHASAAVTIGFDNETLDDPFLAGPSTEDGFTHDLLANSGGLGTHVTLSGEYSSGTRRPPCVASKHSWPSWAPPPC
jgi:hypothetical protein